MVTRKDRRRYSKDFKIQAIKRCEESGKPITEVARELDISVHLLYRWRDDYLKNPNAAFIGTGHNTAKKSSSDTTELQRLKRENARLREERDILKKSLIFFAKDQNGSSNS